MNSFFITPQSGPVTVSLAIRSTNTGFAIFSGKQYQMHGHLSVPDSVREEQNQASFFISNLYPLLDRQRPDKIVIEDSYNPSDSSSGKIFAQIHGALVGYCIMRSCRLFLQSSFLWQRNLELPVEKKYTLLRRQAIQLVDERLGIKVNGEEAIAICVGFSSLLEKDN